MNFTILVFIVLSAFLSEKSFAQDLTTTIKNVESFLEKKEDSYHRAIARANPNQQDFSFEKITLELEELLESEEIERRVEKSHTLRQYLNLMKNHLLHIQLTNEIEPFSNLIYMYPHEMPFVHDGRYPLVPSFQVLKKLSEFLKILSSEEGVKAQNWEQIRFARAYHFLSHSNIAKLAESEAAFTMDQLRRLEGGEPHSQRVDFFKMLLQKKISPEDVIAIEDSVYSLQEKNLVNRISSAPHKAYDDFRTRIENQGINASFKAEFEPIVRKLELALLTQKNVEDAINTEPRLSIMHANALRRIRKIINEDHYPYREVLDEVTRITEFFDMVERSYGPKKSNPLHYAKRYEYYMHTVYGWAPQHITILSSSHLKTYDLLSISSAPIGFAGVATESLWVDSYLQSPNEFLIHDAGNHERRRYKFTRNYFFRLGIEEKDFPKIYHNIDAFLQKEMLPLIRRIDRFKSAAMEFSSKEQFLSEFLAMLPGKEYFTEEIEELKEALKTATDLKALNDEFRVKINRKKTLYDMILFEVVHEDALPPAKQAILESLMRPPNLPMPRDFIDIQNKVAHHTMEPAGTTMAYILQKLNGSFYDTPKKRMLAVSAPEYRTPKSIIQATAEIVQIFGGYEGMTKEQSLQQLVFLTLSEEGFLTYLTEEFQRDLHPLQKDLLRTLKYVEGLEVLSLIGEFRTDSAFKEFVKQLRKRIELAQNLEATSQDSEVEKVKLSFLEFEKGQSFSFEESKNYYFKLGQELNERIFYRVRGELRKKDPTEKQSIKQIERTIDFLEQTKASLKEKLQKQVSSEDFESLEKLTFKIEALKRSIVKKRREAVAEDFIARSGKLWEQIKPDSVNRDKIVFDLAVRFHDRAWLPNFRSVYGTKAQYRDVPSTVFLQGETQEEARQRFEDLGYIGLRISSEGRFQQNINLPSNKLIEELFYELNTRLAEKYVDLILDHHRQGKDLNSVQIDQLASKIHDLFLENNILKVETAMHKLKGPETYSLNEVLSTVESMRYTDWEKLNIDEVNALRQFRPKSKLSAREVSNDKAMVVNVLDKMFADSFAENLLSELSSDWKRIDFSDLDLDRASKEVAEEMHKSWLNHYRSFNGDEARYRSIPLERFEGVNEQDLFRILTEKGIKGLTMDHNKGLSQNINQEVGELVPQLFEKMTIDAARTYIHSIKEAHKAFPELTEDLVRTLAEVIHQNWMQVNKWQLQPSFKKLGWNVNNMNPDDIMEKIRSMEKSQWLLLNPGEIEKIYQFMSAKDLSWDEHRKDFEVLTVAIKTLANPKQKVKFCSKAL